MMKVGIDSELTCILGDLAQSLLGLFCFQEKADPLPDIGV